MRSIYYRDIVTEVDKKYHCINYLMSHDMNNNDQCLRMLKEFNEKTKL